MVWNIGDVDDSGNEGWFNVGNQSTTNNSNNLAVDLENVGNVDNSYEETNTSDTTVVDSGNVGSNNTDWDIDGSFNDNSDNSDNSVDAVVTIDSGNTYLDESHTDNSINIGGRAYNTGYEGWAGFGGDVTIHSQDTILNQSVNQSILGGDVSQGFANSAVSASGEGAVAAGGDVTISRSLDASTNFDAEGDININNTTELTSYDNVGNTTDISVDLTDASQDWTIDNSYNDASTNVDLTDSFNDDFSSSESENWTINADVIWGSGNSEVVDVQLPDDIED
ncbi:hypothetical protein DBR36_09450 [Microbacterium sp. HMWF026]|uniref:hypothetical protein n=1 Tax=Microbacterium sp. HMWF026 TaxID=2056861 RepID=UPI000D35DB16|nr:hypothetical protein [Microbacterium sp. HMWF026]PTT18375.1 hypothetical protein DBR36_09450 [Microbacterium sp. HMWF026]